MCVCVFVRARACVRVCVCVCVSIEVHARNQMGKYVNVFSAKLIKLSWKLKKIIVCDNLDV